jgi:squalene synthase HpnC
VVSAPGDSRSSDRLRAAYAACERLAREHYENFPVASRLLPATARPHIAAIYAFARTADDFADEPGMADAERLKQLDDWGRRLRGLPPAEAPLFPDTAAAELVFIALHNTIREHRLPVTLFEDLLSAFRQDVTTKRYATWTDVFDYCRRSANPVGRLVLRVAGYESARLDEASDAVCTALQLTNFWQDLERDWANGRLYVPLEARDRAAARDRDLDARRMSPEWRTALGAAVERTRELFRAGREVCDGVTGRLRWELRLTWLGGSRILDKLEDVEFDVFRNRPTLGAADVPALLWDALTWRRSGGSSA